MPILLFAFLPLLHFAFSTLPLRIYVLFLDFIQATLRRNFALSAWFYFIFFFFFHVFVAFSPLRTSLFAPLHILLDTRFFFLLLSIVVVVLEILPFALAKLRIHWLLLFANFFFLSSLLFASLYFLLFSLLLTFFLLLLI